MALQRLMIASIPKHVRHFLQHGLNCRQAGHPVRLSSGVGMHYFGSVRGRCPAEGGGRFAV